MKHLAAALAAALILNGCARSDQLDQIMGRTDGTPTPAPKLFDCDLIFPATSKDTLAP
jgi:PBP1b-binding outer membrane lipoprotein LpoB